MNGQGVSRKHAVLLLLALGLLAGLFAMHGVTSSPSPMHVSEPLTVSVASHGSHTKPSEDHGAHEIDCSTGAICFALLAGALLLLPFALGRLIDVLPVRGGSGRLTARRRGPPRPRPPSVYQLSVLRL